MTGFKGQRWNHAANIKKNQVPLGPERGMIRRIPEALTQSASSRHGSADARRPARRPSAPPFWKWQFGLQHRSETGSDCPGTWPASTNRCISSLPPKWLFSAANVGGCLRRMFGKNTINAGDHIVKTARNGLTTWRATREMAIINVEGFLSSVPKSYGPQMSEMSQKPDVSGNSRAISRSWNGMGVPSPRHDQLADFPCFRPGSFTSPLQPPWAASGSLHPSFPS